jgi:hypothetical protein
MEYPLQLQWNITHLRRLMIQLSPRGGPELAHQVTSTDAMPRPATVSFPSNASRASTAIAPGGQVSLILGISGSGRRDFVVEHGAHGAKGIIPFLVA